MQTDSPEPTDRALSASELDRLIKHLRSRDQRASEVIGGWRREFPTDDCLAADYLEALRAELPSWQVQEGANDDDP